MKFKITYEFDARYGTEKPFWAESEGISRCGANWAEAKDKLLDDLRQIAKMEEAKQIPPASEEVEL